MGVVSQHSPPCCHLNRRLLVKKRSSRQQVKIPLCRKRRILCSKVHYRTESRALSNKDHSLLNGKVARPSKTVEGFSGDSNGYVIGSEDEVGSMSETGDSVTMVLIPGLPDESNGECGAPISSCFWEWKPKFNVHYEISGSQNVNSPPLLFLPGFGVGSFHYEKQLKDLGRDYRVWAIDFLGQGMSLPTENPTSSSKEEDLVWGFGDKTEPWATDLVYSMDLWRDQVLCFVEEVLIDLHCNFNPLFFCNA
ncbi:hypothetical protein Gohar_004660 [Gossypium harknessii]|uniref:AB hydrolase-1 domain-containing protein n=1 Tax=Gossypium harknessii TaxID=34285 RepID=A0A7J9H5M9_9ROSI|nr:hypothetical protein [Gossypium harknessii]